jgi:hypothetical protein
MLWWAMRQALRNELSGVIWSPFGLATYLSVIFWLKQRASRNPRPKNHELRKRQFLRT